MASIELTIPNDKVDRVLDAFEGIYDLPKDESGTPLYTKVEWAKRQLRQHVLRTVKRWEQQMSDIANVVEEDGTIVDP